MARAEFRHWVTVPTRFRDLDPMGHVNSSVYFSYFELARTSYFDASGVSAMRVEGTWGIPVVAQACNYRRQVFHPSTLEVGLRCAEMREKTVHLVYGLFLEDSDELLAGATSVSAWVDLTLPRAVPLPAELRASIETYESNSR